MDQPYFENNKPLQAIKSSPLDLVRSSLEEVIKGSPPPKAYDEDMQEGIFFGPTGFAYLLLQLSELYPDLEVQQHKLRYWAERYLEPDRGTLALEDGKCGVLSEKLSFDALHACFTRNVDDVKVFLASYPAILKTYPSGVKDVFKSEMLYGRAGALYLLRMVRHWVPEAASAIDPVMKQLAERILQSKDENNGIWTWNGERYIGAMHGDVGIILQIVRSVPELASKLSIHLEALLDFQDSQGNWPATVAAPGHKSSGKPDRVQLCHGAPGFACSLRVLRPYFPDLHQRIDEALIKAEEVIWTRGLLKKEPNICHGIFGNAL